MRFLSLTLSWLHTNCQQFAEYLISLVYDVFRAAAATLLLPCHILYNSPDRIQHGCFHQVPHPTTGWREKLEQYTGLSYWERPAIMFRSKIHERESMIVSLHLHTVYEPRRESAQLDKICLNKKKYSLCNAGSHHYNTPWCNKVIKLGIFKTVLNMQVFGVWWTLDTYLSHPHTTDVLKKGRDVFVKRMHHACSGRS